MIDFIKGTLAEKSVGYVTVEACGVGYEIIIPLSTLDKLPSVNGDVKLFTHHHVREDAQKLYGFIAKQERELFRQMIGVSSIGPKTAISILSKLSVDELIRFITLGDASRLTKIPGIGAKTAERLIVELRGKLKITSAPAVEPSGKSSGAPAVSEDGSRQEAIEALISLGYNEKQVTRAIERVTQSRGEPVEYGVEEWIKKALQVI